MLHHCVLYFALFNYVVFSYPIRCYATVEAEKVKTQWLQSFQVMYRESQH